MYISELKIHGFKSFIKSETLEFGEGITAIVGPNGCGKTNIVDAIRWVLGEQKYSVLRSGRMEDVIFNGAKGFKPLSVCEVFLTVHNDKGKLPVEYTDVEIGRRIYRNGESEYFLNKTLCRLKDIQDLFIDTGMGADAYSVIELKMIEQILSETAGERKHMFEEAAGINKYKSQRKSALRKFEATKHDLNRITDIINEVDDKVRGLGLQMKRYKRYETLQSDLREKEIILAATIIKQLKHKINPIAAEISRFQNSKLINVSDETEFDTNLVKLREEYHQQEKDITVRRTKIDTLENDREAKHQLIIVSKEQNRSDNNSIERLRNESSDLGEKQSGLRIKIDDLKNELLLIEPLIKEQSEKYSLLKSKFEEEDKKFGSADILVNSLQDQRWELQKKLTDKRSIILKTDTLIEDKKLQNEKTHQKIKSLKLKLKQALDENSSIASKRTKYIDEVKNLDNDLVKLKEKLSKSRLNLDNQQKQLNSKYNSEESLESRLNFFQNLIVSMDDHPRGVKYVLNNKDKFNDVLGTISEILKPEKKYELAIEAALGDLTYCLVTENRKAALKLLETANRKKIGQLSVIPLADLNTESEENGAIPKNSQIIDLAVKLVETDSRVKMLASSLLNNVLVVNNLSEALKDKSLDSWNLVDLNGNCSSSSQVLKNSAKSSDDLALGRADKINTINAELNETKTSIESIEHQIRNDRNLILEQENNLETLEQSKRDVNLKIKSLETDEIRFDLEKSQLEESIQEMEVFLNELSNARHHQIKALGLLQKESEKLEENVELHLVKLKEAANNITELREKRDGLHKSMQDARISLLNNENKIDNIKIQSQSIKATIKEIDVRKKLVKEELDTLKSDIEKRSKNIEIDSKLFESIVNTIQSNRSKQDLQQKVLNDTFKQIEDLQSLIKTKQRDRENILEQVKRYELQVSELNQEIIFHTEKIKERYQCQIPDDVDQNLGINQLEAEIEKTTRSIEKIGPVNMAVQLEYEEEAKRLDLLRSQKADLISAEANLRETIEKIDNIARTQLKESFNQIKKNFENLFTMFFEGGHGTISFIGDPDPLEAEIAIQAQPPGKRNQAVRVLSAGEKSLTAIALLFAIYQYKPSPYCIFDEIDAPLDDVNIRKFTRVLRKFQDDTQFIVVTHNKLTMEAADFLYGVTMEQKGISKLVSVAFDT